MRGEQPGEDAAITNTSSVPTGIVKRVARRRPTISASTTPTGIPSARADQRGDHLSWRIIWRICRRDMPIARSIPSSRVRSKTDRISVFTIPNRHTIIDSESST